MFVGTTIGTVLVIQNEVILNKFNDCVGNIAVLTSILFYNYDFIATKCFKSHNHLPLYLLYPNRKYTSKTTSSLSSYYIEFDSKGGFIQISSQQISIYN